MVNLSFAKAGAASPSLGAQVERVHASHFDDLLVVVGIRVLCCLCMKVLILT